MKSDLEAPDSFIEGHCLGMNCVPLPKFICLRLNPLLLPVNVSIFGGRDFKEVIKLKGGRSVGPSSNMTGGFMRRGNQGRSVQKEDRVKAGRR